MRKALKLTSGFIGAVLLYLFLMVDRLILVPFQMVSSYSAQELNKKADRYSAYPVIRVSVAAIVITIYSLIKLVF